MRQRLELGAEIEREVKKLDCVTATNLGKPTWGRGKRKIKMRNGTPGLISIEICEPQGKQTLYVYSKNCAQTIGQIREYAQRNAIPINT